MNWILIVIILLLAGPVFCGWVCPFGFIQDLMSLLRKKIGMQTTTLKHHHQLKYLRYLLYIVFLANITYIIFNILIYDPRAALEQFLGSKTLSLIGLISISVFTILSLFVDRFFCKYLCIEGAKQSLLSSGKLMRVSRNSTCIDCGKCNKACPMGIHVTKDMDVEALECINCLSCVGTCPVDKAITVKTLIKPKRLLISVILILIIIVSPQIMTATSNGMEKTNDNSMTEVLSSDNDTEAFQGSARGFKGDISVLVEKEGDIITSITVLDHNDDMPWYNHSTSVIQSMIDAQSTDVDSISGATYTSQGIINATKDALGQEYKDLTPTSGRGKRH